MSGERAWCYSSNCNYEEYDIGTESRTGATCTKLEHFRRNPAVRLFIEDDIILLGVEVVLSAHTTHSMMPSTLWPLGVKRHIETDDC
jgi:hypothetical protein